MEQLKNSLTKSFEWNADSIKSMLKQPDLNESEKGHIFMKLGMCKLAKAILKVDCEDYSLIGEYEALEHEVFKELLK